MLEAQVAEAGKGTKWFAQLVRRSMVDVADPCQPLVDSNMTGVTWALGVLE